MDQMKDQGKKLKGSVPDIAGPEDKKVCFNKICLVL